MAQSKDTTKGKNRRAAKPQITESWLLTMLARTQSGVKSRHRPLRNSQQLKTPWDKLYVKLNQPGCDGLSEVSLLAYFCRTNNAMGVQSACDRNTRLFDEKNNTPLALLNPSVISSEKRHALCGVLNRKAKALEASVHPKAAERLTRLIEILNKLKPAGISKSNAWSCISVLRLEEAIKTSLSSQLRKKSEHLDPNTFKKCFCLNFVRWLRDPDNQSERSYRNKQAKVTPYVAWKIFGMLFAHLKNKNICQLVISAELARTNLSQAPELKQIYDAGYNLLLALSERLPNYPDEAILSQQLLSIDAKQTQGEQGLLQATDDYSEHEKIPHSTKDNGIMPMSMLPPKSLTPLYTYACNGTSNDTSNDTSNQVLAKPSFRPPTASLVCLRYP